MTRLFSSQMVGVAPGTTMVQLDGCPPDPVGWMAQDRLVGITGLGAIPTKANIRWDIIGLVGGGALVVALLAGLVSSAFTPPRPSKGFKGLDATLNGLGDTADWRRGVLKGKARAEATRRRFGDADVKLAANVLASDARRPSATDFDKGYAAAYVAVAGR